jgi:hypothetical protein
VKAEVEAAAVEPMCKVRLREHTPSQ